MSDSLRFENEYTSSPSITRFCIDPTNLEKWMRQNKAKYTGTFIEGCLLDNFVLVCKRGFAAVYERYVNCWTSNYMIEFQPGPAQDVWRGWYQFEEGYEANAG